TEDAPPYMIETDGNDRGRTAFEDLLKAAVEGKEKARARDAALAEDAHDLALCECFAGSTQRLDNGPRPCRAIYRDHRRKLQQETQAGQPRVGRPHQEAHQPLLREKHQEGINKADMIANKQGRAAGRNVLSTEYMDAIQQMRGQP